ncbi:unnamed protein product [Mycena citricolor]|uniref:Uncharacterized protein n=1 Tax=Mycena citricolor TaxID=2018698 RepID=A0AAD2HLE7_9AGAR|nr:unnamed protein product [Mycena citricolor]
MSATSKIMAGLLARPTSTELQACWELCRLHNNIGFWVVWLPTAWSIAMALKAQPELPLRDAAARAVLYVPLCFGVKSLIMTVDDLLDYDIDALVARTRDRALPRGAISRARAWAFFALQASLGVVLACGVLSRTALYASMTVWPLYVIYPTCKRWTNLAPVPLGLMFKIGVFMGWSDVSVDGSVAWHVLIPVYLGACCWTLTYETIYQHQDKLDDRRLGIHSPALLCGAQTIPVCTGTACAFLGLLTYGGAANGHGALFFGAVAVAGALLLSALAGTDIDAPADCKRFFLKTPMIGQIILAGLAADVLWERAAGWRGV